MSYTQGLEFWTQAPIMQLRGRYINVVLQLFYFYRGDTYKEVVNRKRGGRVAKLKEKTLIFFPSYVQKTWYFVWSHKPFDKYKTGQKTVIWRAIFD